MNTKGIILAGGSGTRLWPSTKIISKQLLPVYDKPMIYYPLSTLMLAGIREVLIISTPEDTPRIRELLQDGSQLGMNIQYTVQQAPNGLAEAFLLGKNFLGNDSVCLILGDNIFYGNNFSRKLQWVKQKRTGATLFGYYVNDPERFGIVEFDGFGKVLSIEEKPKNPKSNWAAVGLYFYDNDVISIAENIKPSKRGELEITAVNQVYLERGTLEVEKMGRGYAWLDSGTHESLLEASNFIKIMEDRQGFKISCIEEVAWRMGFIDTNQLIKLGSNLAKSSYGQYILRIAKEGF